jgi:TonB family protein
MSLSDRTPLIWALAASAVVHTAFVAMPHALPGQGSSARAESGGALQARLAAPDYHATDLSVEASSPFLQFLAPVVAPPLLPLASAIPSPRSPAQTTLGVGGSANVRIDGEALVQSERLGELLSRQQTEFPVEVDSPARLVDRIRAIYPPEALAEGREGSVVVWIVVDARGVVEEILIAEGTEEFSAAVIEAVRQARFVPAQNKFVPVRFPLALEFHFGIGRQALAGRSATAAH